MVRMSYSKNSQSVGNIQSNVPDYQKIQASGWSGVPPNIADDDDLQTLTPSPVIKVPTSSGHSTPTTSRRNIAGDSRAYQPSKYGLVSDDHKYEFGVSQNQPYVEVSRYSRQPAYDDQEVHHRNSSVVSKPYQRHSYHEEIHQLQESAPRSVPYNEYTMSPQMSQTNIARGAPNSQASHMESHYKTPPKIKPALSFTSVPVDINQVYVPQPETSRTKIHYGYEHGRQSADLLPTTSKVSPTDMHSWQKRHQQVLQHQIQEMQDLSSKRTGSYESIFQQANLRDDDANRWPSNNLVAIQSAADDIIREKDVVINSLKVKLMHLEDRLIGSREHTDDDTIGKLQRLQYQNSSLKAELISMKSKNNEIIDGLEIKLGAAEEENMDLKRKMRKNQQDTGNMMSELSQKDDEAMEWKQKCHSFQADHQEMKRKLDNLQNYLGDLPTVEETTKSVQEISQLKSDNEILQTRVRELERKLQYNKKLVSSRELKIRELEDKEGKLSQKVHEVTEEVNRIKMDGDGAELARMQDELKQTKSDKELLNIQLEKLRKLMEKNVRQIRHDEVKHQSELSNLKERINQEEEAVNALREDVNMKDDQLLRMKTSVKELGSQNQDLKEQNLILKEQVKGLEQQTTDESLKIQRKLMRELSQCFSELQAVVQTCLQRAKGEDPNMSILLGVRAPSPSEEQQQEMASGTTETTMKYWLMRIKNMRSEVEKLRGMICNKYAEDMGDNLNCNTQ